MAKVRNNRVMQGPSRMLGNQILVEQDTAERIMPSQYYSKRVFGEIPTQHRNDFREATAYAQTTQTAQLYANKPMVTAPSPFNFAVANWFNMLEILDLDLGNWRGQPGKVLRVKTQDDVLVTQVDIAIRDDNGALLEVGYATQVDNLWWEYTTCTNATGNLTVYATAQDMSGETTEMSKSI